MISGVLYALLAGMMWGLIFVGPLIVPEYPAILQSTGRYLALGLIALPLAWLGRALAPAQPSGLGTALALTMMGNLIYYVCLASAIQRTGAPVSTMIIGTLPVVIPVFANLLYSQRDGKLAWSKMVPALVCTAVGLVCVNIAELRHGQADLTCGATALASAGVHFRGVLGMVCPAQCALAAGEPGQAPDDVGDGAGAGHAARLAGGICGACSG
jgi:drug/metabolite transporter (DMT)-like permease